MSVESYLQQEIASRLDKKIRVDKKWDVEAGVVKELLKLYIPFFFDTLESGLCGYKKVMIPEHYKFVPALILEDKYLITAGVNYIYVTHLISPLLVDWMKIKPYPSRTEWNLLLLDLVNEYTKSLIK